MRSSPDPRVPVALLAPLLLVSCASFTPQPVRILPPVELLQACEEPAGSAQTNGAMAEWLLSFREALRGCNADKTALREWAK